MAGNSKRKVDKKWEKIFNDLPILEEINDKGYFKITSGEINKYREARLMTKFDHRKNLPVLFKKNDISILPIKRGEYILGKFDIYKDINLDYDEIEPKEINFPHWIESIDYNDLYSEEAAMKTAFISGIYEDLVGGEVIPTIGGRMSTGEFDFKVKSKARDNFYQKIKVKNSQCQIDGGYESNNNLLMVEAKNSISDDFIVRQLYYPYRLWQEKIEKEVVPIFMIYSNDIFSFYIYKFKSIEKYNSLELIEERHYTIKDEKITYKDLEKIYEGTDIIEEPKVPFPQADTFNRVIDLTKALLQSDLSSDEITTRYDFDKRQADYYSNACRYLGLIEKVGMGEYSITEKGKTIITQNKRQKNLMLARCILEHKVFNELFDQYLKKGQIDKQDAIDLMIKYSDYLYNIDSKTTIKRRSSSVISWVEWIINLKVN